MNRLVKALLLGFMLVITGCAPRAVSPQIINAEGGSYREIPATELRQMAATKDFTLVNVHVPFAGNIPGTDLSIPYDQITQNLSALPEDRNAKIVLYCRSGRMSTLVAEELVRLGYTNIWNLQGGMVEWENAGYPIEQ